MVTKPMPGSCTSRASSVASSWRISSPTRSGRDPCGISAEVFHLALHDEARLDAVDFPEGRRQRLAGHVLGAGDGHDAEARALPEILVRDFSHGDIEGLEPILDATQHHSLVLQR